MSTTVAKSAKKSVVAKKTTKAAAKTTAPAKSKPSAQTALKTAAAKIAKAVKSPLKPAAKATKTTQTTKATGKVAGKETAPAKVSTQKSGAAAVKTTAKKTVKSPPAMARETEKETEKERKARPAAKTESKAKDADKNIQQSDPLMSVGNMSAVIVDNIQKSGVSKVSEVATKTTKSISVVPEDGALLTEAQILSMKDNEYMNPAQLAFFKARLQQLEKELLKNAGETTEHLRETVLVPDPADRATIEEEHALELRTRDRERKLLRKVRESLAAIESGDYGYCGETGDPIGIPRLLARPTATLSLEAQQRSELKRKLYGD